MSPVVKKTLLASGVVLLVAAAASAWQEQGSDRGVTWTSVFIFLALAVLTARRAFDGPDSDSRALARVTVFLSGAAVIIHTCILVL
jgi:hypothetical protein